MKRESGRIARHHSFAGAKRSGRAVVDRLEPRSYFSLGFAAPVFDAGVSAGTGIATADLNGDGKPDLVVSGVNPTVSAIPVVAVYLDSAGTFGTPTLLSFNGTPGGVATGDFTNDGHTDIAVVDSTDNELILYTGSGTGTFTPSVGAGLAGGTGATSLAVADFNGDHFADIAVAEPPQNQVEIQFGKGNGSFAAESSISVPSPRQVIAADVNGDGNPDLIISSGNGNIYVALNSGTGTFAAPVSYALGATLTSINSLAVADVNGDNQPDLIAVGDTGVAGSTTGAVAVLLNQGAGVFGAAAVTATPIDPLDLVTGNFTGSGHTDLGIISASSAFDILQGIGDGTFGAAVPIFTTQLDMPGAQAVAADFNGDGLSDVAFLSPSQNGIGVMLNTTNGVVTPPPVMATPSPLVPVLSGKLPAAPVVSGGKITPIREVVKLTNNSGATVSGAITLNLVLGTTATGEAGDPVIATIGKTVAIKAHKTKTFSLPVKTLPAGITGPYYILAEVTDPSKLTNLGASAATISVVAPTIDLTGAFVKTPTTVKLGGKASFTFSITNDGTVLAAGVLPLQVQASTTAGISATSVIIDKASKKVNIKPGKTIKMQVSRVISTIAGPYYLVVQLDPGNTLGDVNTANNTFVTASAITVG